MPKVSDNAIMGVISEFMQNIFGKPNSCRHRVKPVNGSPARITRADIKQQPIFRQPDSAAITGDIECMIYVYDGRPLTGIPLGTVFNADIVRSRVKLRSTLTGGTWDGGTDDGIAFAYRGIPFGVSFNEGLVELLLHRNAAFITMRYDDWYDKRHGIPNVKAFGPSTRHSLDVDEASRLSGVSRFDVSTSVQTVSVNVGKHSDAVENVLRGYGKIDVDVTLVMIPTPKGSSAKPHIGVLAPSGGEAF